MAVLFVLGFSSGLPIYLTGSTLQAWLTQAGVQLDQIAAFSLVGLAYTFKFAWAPLLDRFRWPFLGRRRGWVLVTQIGLAVSIATMGFLDPVTQPGLLAILAICVAVFSASQDVVLDAYSTDILTPEQRAAGAAVYFIGYRVAMLVTGTVALFMADYVPWSVTYGVIASMVLIGIAGTLFAEEPPMPDRPASTLVEAVYRPFAELFKRLGSQTALLVLAFVAVYKFGDYFAQSLLIAFFRRGAGFDFREIATFYKVFGFFGVFFGGFVAGMIAPRLGIRRMLVIFGILQAVTNLFYVWLAVVGHSYLVFAAAVLCDNIAGAIGTAAFIAFMMSVCSSSVSATQMALLTSLSSVGQRIFGPFSDNIVTNFEWSGLGELANHSAIIAREVTPLAERLVAAMDWGAYAELLSATSKLRHIFDPLGDGTVASHNWPLFFVVTALMAIPGIILAAVVARRVE
jgi:PAT family beta-lactamase induction signal transducer AmpG